MKTMQANKRTLMLAPVTAATTARTANLDTQGADYATIEIVLGAEANTNSTNVVVQLSEADAATAAFATFNADFNRTLDNTAGIVAAYHVDLKARKRFIKLTVTPDTTANGAVISSAVGILQLENANSANSSNADVVVVG
jgi:hypothetical protein